MTIYVGSKYENSVLRKDIENNITYLGELKEVYSANIDDITIPFKEGMRVDLLANEYYKDPQLDWVIMQANPKYASPEDIQVGDLIVIPSPGRVL